MMPEGLSLTELATAVTGRIPHPLDVLAAEIRAAHESVVRHSRHTAESALEAGEKLIIAKLHPDTQGIRWQDWVEQKARVPYRNAQRYAQLFISVHGGVVLRQDVAELGIFGALRLDFALRGLTPEQRTMVRDRMALGTRVMEARRLVLADDRVNAELLMPSGKFRVIYADPPWSYGNTQPDTFGEQRDHYPVMSLADICALPVLDWALDDAVLYLWVTAPMALDVAAVIDAWGFEYKAQFIWHKERHVQGHYNSVRHELLYVCTRGACQPDVRRLFPSVYTEPRADHSRKPEYFYSVIETLYPRGRRLELFRRGPPRDGWEAYGNEVTGAADRRTGAGEPAAAATGEVS